MPHLGLVNLAIVQFEVSFAS